MTALFLFLFSFCHFSHSFLLFSGFIVLRVFVFDHVSRKKEKRKSEWEWWNVCPFYFPLILITFHTDLFFTNASFFFYSAFISRGNNTGSMFNFLETFRTKIINISLCLWSEREKLCWKRGRFKKWFKKILIFNKGSNYARGNFFFFFFYQQGISLRKLN